MKVVSDQRSARVLWIATARETHGGVASYVRVIEESPLWSTWSIELIATHCDGSRARKIVAFLNGLARVVWTLIVRRPCLVHVNTSAHGSIVRKSVIAWVCRVARVPVVLHVHGSDFDEFYERSSAILRYIIRATMQKSARVVALGGRWAVRLGKIAPDSRIVAIPNAVMVREGVRPLARERPLRVIFLGRICDDKGTFTLLDAWAALAADAEASGQGELVIAGDDEVERAERVVERLGLSSSVRVRAWLSPTETRDLLESADVLVLPSKMEGQPMAVLEAMAAGICVVASDVGGIPDLIENGVSGLLVPPSDVGSLTAALRTVLTDRETRRRLAEAALKRVQREFDVRVVEREIDSLYRLVLSSARSMEQLPARLGAKMELD